MYLKWKRFWEALFNWELWPFALRYLYISPVWLWYCVRSGSLWYFTSSNPTITFGGFEGEGKKEMYAQLPNGIYPKTVFFQPHVPLEQVLADVKEAGFTFPVCTKPDVGMKGLLFRKIDSELELAIYHNLAPSEYMVQELIAFPLEVSVFYYRYPNREKGVITGFIQKVPLEVKGDGVKTLLQLIQEHPKAKYHEKDLRLKYVYYLNEIIATDVRFQLSYAANLNRGARFINLQHQIDEDLHLVFDALSHTTNFYYGRYDIKCKSIDDLKKGQQYSILEFNGSGAEPNHVYNAGYSLFGAQAVFLQHWKVLFEISRYNHQQGFRYWSFYRGLQFTKAAKKHLRLLEQYERKILL